MPASQPLPASHPAHLRSAAYTYALMEPQPYAARMQDEMIGQIEAAQPKSVVFVGDRDVRVPRPSSNRRIFEWIERYTLRRTSEAPCTSGSLARPTRWSTAVRQAPRP